MDKAGWQVTSGILALAAVGGIFGTVANKRALQQQLASERTCPSPAVADPPPCPSHQQLHYGLMEWPDGVRCQGGVLLIRTAQGFESLTQRGRAMACTENPHRR